MTRQGGKYSIEYRSLLMSLVSCCPSVYQARTICRSVIKYCCGWMVEGKDFVVPQLQFLKDARRDLAPMSECLAAIRVALCDRVVQMGHDGSSIGGVDTFTVTVKIFTRSEGGGAETGYWRGGGCVRRCVDGSLGVARGKEVGGGEGVYRAGVCAWAREDPVAAQPAGEGGT